MNSTIKKRVVSMRLVDRGDYTDIIINNLQTLEKDFVLIDEKENMVIVKNDSDADLKFKTAKPGKVVAVGTTEHGESLYRLYLVSPDLLT